MGRSIFVTSDVASEELLFLVADSTALNLENVNQLSDRKSSRRLLVLVSIVPKPDTSDMRRRDPSDETSCK